MCEIYFWLSKLLMLHFYEIADNDFIDCILEKKTFPPTLNVY